MTITTATIAAALRLLFDTALSERLDRRKLG
jgi:hypothetical protein